MVDVLNELGAPMTPQELGKLLKLDPRTVIKYYQRWDGVEVVPGKFRFFENRVREILNQAMRENVSSSNVSKQAPRPVSSRFLMKKLGRFKNMDPKGQKDSNRHGLFCT